MGEHKETQSQVSFKRVEANFLECMGIIWKWYSWKPQRKTVILTFLQQEHTCCDSLAVIVEICTGAWCNCLISALLSVSNVCLLPCFSIQCYNPPPPPPPTGNTSDERRFVLLKERVSVFSSSWWRLSSTVYAENETLASRGVWRSSINQVLPRKVKAPSMKAVLAVCMRVCVNTMPRVETAINSQEQFLMPVQPRWVMRPFPNNLRVISEIHFSQGRLFKTAIITEEANWVSAQR